MTYETTIAKGIDEWLRAEVRESKMSRNRVWDDHREIRASYSRELRENTDALKVGGHFNRFQMLIGLYPEMRADDAFTGKLVHFALMFVSGNFRTQCHLESSNQRDYEVLRYGKNDIANGAASPTIGREVKKGIDRFDSFDPTDVEGVIAESKRLNTAIYNKHQVVFDWHRENPGRATDALDSSEAPVSAVFECQELALQLAAGHISLAAQIRGDLAEVPIFEPKSITDATQMQYPFASAQ